MLRKRLHLIALLLVVVLSLAALPVQAQSKLEIRFWHAMGGEARGKVIQKLIDDFNAANPDIHVTAEYKGDYPSLFNAALLVSRQKTAPHIVQIYEVGSQLANDSGVFVPIADVTDDAGKKLLGDVIPTVAAYYSINGKYNSVPWNSSNPVLYYDQEILKAAGLDPAKPPETWADLKAACKKIMDSKAAPNCISFNLHGWFFEQWMALENQPLVNNDNGRAGQRPTASNLDSKAATDIFTFWKDLYDSKYFIYSGKLEDWDGSTAIFQSKQVAFLIDSTSDVADNEAASSKGGFTLGVGKMPINDKVERNGNVIGGASLWIVGGHPDAETKAAAKFALYLIQPEQMVTWHKGSGYLPITKGSQKLLNDEKWFDKNPAFRVALDQLNAGKANSASAGALIGPFQKVRDIVEESAQSMFNGKMDVKAALADAKKRVDAELATYHDNFK